MTAIAEVLHAETRKHHAPSPRSVGRHVAAAGMPRDLPGSLHVLTCGSVDDGKSTLIGRLLWDTGALHTDQRQALQRSALTAAGTPDFSLLVDGLVAEREQGITIDIAWRYFDTDTRRLVIIDSPGHEQYTRNMATGASHADAAILLVDARAGIKAQTRRHLAILDLMGVGHVILVVNKMDLVGWREERFREIETAFGDLAGRFGFRRAMAVPASAVLGDNIARHSAAMPWHSGLTLLERLQEVPTRETLAKDSFRYPVQMVVRGRPDFRGLAGTVASGEIAIGSEVVDALSGGRARVRRIVTMGRDLQQARAGQAVVLQLDTDIDISRGAVLAFPGHEPFAVDRLGVRLVWLADEPFDPSRGYLLRTATDQVPVTSIDISAHLDLDSLAERPATTCAANDIATARISLARRTVAEQFSRHRETGSFLLIDAVTGASVAGGVVMSVQQQEHRRPQSTFLLTRSLLKQGVGADLGHDADAEEELRRRANEVAILLRGAGVAVEIEDQWTGAPSAAATLGLGVLAALSFGFALAIVLGLL